MIRQINLCTHCADTISNPLCPYCFARHVMLWLNDKNLSDKQNKFILAGLKRFIRESEETPSDMICIICGKEEVKFCTYCSINRATRIIEKVAGVDVAENFSEDFDAKIWQKIY